MGWTESILVILTGLLYRVKGDVLCISDDFPSSSTWCYGDGAYCCDTYSDTCCYHTFVYQYWWFWSIWVIIFFSIVTCIICLRRRRARMNYVQFGQPQYGTSSVVTTTSTSSNQNVAYPQGYPQGYPPQQGYPQQGYPQPAQQGYQQPAPAGYPAAAPPNYSDVAPPGYTQAEKTAPPINQ